jgi:hypothetical protein
VKVQGAGSDIKDLVEGENELVVSIEDNNKEEATRATKRPH